MTMLLSSFVTNRYLPTRVGVSKSWAKNLTAATERFSQHLGKPAKLSDLTTVNVGGFLTDYARAWKPRSTNDQRQILLMFWRAAKEQGLVKTDLKPELIRVLPEELDPPEAWNEDQVNTLMVKLAEQSGEICGIPAGDWWLSLTLTIYETSTRISAMLATPPTAYDGVGVLVRKQKNHKPQWQRLSEQTREIIGRVLRYGRQNRQALWEHPWNPRCVWKNFRRIVESAGLPAPRTHRQLFQRLRRTTITLVARVDQALAQKTAGHSDFKTTREHYIDPRLMDERCAADVLPDPLRKLRELDKQHLLYESRKPAFRIFG